MLQLNFLHRRCDVRAETERKIKCVIQVYDRGQSRRCSTWPLDAMATKELIVNREKISQEKMSKITWFRITLMIDGNDMGW